MLFRAIERLAFSNRREAGYFLDGVGSLDTWLSFRRLRKYASHPILVVQTAFLPAPKPTGNGAPDSLKKYSRYAETAGQDRPGRALRARGHRRATDAGSSGGTVCQPRLTLEAARVRTGPIAAPRPR